MSVKRMGNGQSFVIQEGLGLILHTFSFGWGFLLKSRTGQDLHGQRTLQGIVIVLSQIDIRCLDPLFYRVLPYPDDLLAFFLSHHAGCFHLFSNMEQKLRSLPFMVHLIVILIMGRDGNLGDIPLIVPRRGDNDTPDLRYFAWTFSQYRTALSLD
jgi:hypothetical protein